MENIYKASLTMNTDLGLSPANQGNNAMYKLGPIVLKLLFRAFCGKITFLLYTVSS